MRHTGQGRHEGAEKSREAPHEDRRSAPAPQRILSFGHLLPSSSDDAKTHDLRAEKPPDLVPHGGAGVGRGHDQNDHQSPGKPSVDGQEPAQNGRYLTQDHKSEEQGVSSEIRAKPNSPGQAALRAKGALAAEWRKPEGDPDRWPAASAPNLRPKSPPAPMKNDVHPPRIQRLFRPAYQPDGVRARDWIMFTGLAPGYSLPAHREFSAFAQ